MIFGYGERMGRGSQRRLLFIYPQGDSLLPTSGALVAQRLSAKGYEIDLTPPARTSWGRFFQLGLASFWRVRDYKLVVVGVYGGRAFAYEALAILASRLWGKKTWIFFHGGWMGDLVRRKKWLYKPLLNLAHRKICPSTFLKEELERLNIPIDLVIPNSIELEKYSFRVRAKLKPKLLFLRGTHPMYNPEMAIEVFKAVQGEFPEASLTIAGRDLLTHLEFCKKLVERLKLSNVIFLGMVPKSSISQLAAEHDLYLQTNRVENMPTSVLEMWACGLPIVATDVGGTSHLIRSQVDGILVPLNDVDAMAKNCVDLLKNEARVRSLTLSGYERVKGFSWDRVEGLWRDALDVEVQ